MRACAPSLLTIAVDQGMKRPRVNAPVIGEYSIPKAAMAMLKTLSPKCSAAKESAIVRSPKITATKEAGKTIFRVVTMFSAATCLKNTWLFALFYFCLCVFSAFFSSLAEDVSLSWRWYKRLQVWGSSVWQTNSSYLETGRSKRQGAVRCLLSSSSYTVV